MEVDIKINSEDREGTVSSFTAALQQAFGLPPEKTRPGVELAFDAHGKVLELLMDASDPMKVDMAASAAAMFTWTFMEKSHALSSESPAAKACAAAALFNMAGED